MERLSEEKVNGYLTCIEHSCDECPCRHPCRFNGGYRELAVALREAYLTIDLMRNREIQKEVDLCRSAILDTGVSTASTERNPTIIKVVPAVGFRKE